MKTSVGIGLTNDCNLGCAHCYRPQGRIYHLTLADVRTICHRLEVASFNMGTGESWLHPQLADILHYLAGQGTPISMASNGHSLTQMPVELLRMFHDVEVSIDFATPQGQDAFRGDGNWACVMAAIERCHAEGIEVTILATLMSTNYQEMDGLAALARALGTNLRVNVYQPVFASRFSPGYAQFWEGFRRLLDAGQLLSTSEPILHATLGLGTLLGSPCGRRSIRFTPQGHITPCVYWPEPDLTLASLDGLTAEGILESRQFLLARHVPVACRSCPLVAQCGGGCASRRALLGDLDRPDIYCPVVRGERMHISFSAAPAKDLPRSGNVCTTLILP